MTRWVASLLVGVWLVGCGVQGQHAEPLEQSAYSSQKPLSMYLYINPTLSDGAQLVADAKEIPEWMGPVKEHDMWEAVFAEQSDGLQVTLNASLLSLDTLALSASSQQHASAATITDSQTISFSSQELGRMAAQLDEKLGLCKEAPDSFELTDAHFEVQFFDSRAIQKSHSWLSVESFEQANEIQVVFSGQLSNDECLIQRGIHRIPSIEVQGVLSTCSERRICEFTCNKRATADSSFQDFDACMDACTAMGCYVFEPPGN